MVQCIILNLNAYISATVRLLCVVMDKVLSLSLLENGWEVLV